MALEEELLGNKDETKTWKSGLKEEVKKLSSLAAPMVVVSVSQYLVQFASLTLAGHIDELSLSGVAIASSFTNVTGFSLVALIGVKPVCGSRIEYRKHTKFGTKSDALQL